MDDDYSVKITENITINKQELKYTVMGDISSKLHNNYNWDFIIDDAIKNGVDLEEETITVRSHDWVFIYHIETLDQIRGIGI
jgi:hypothetical protein